MRILMFSINPLFPDQVNGGCTKQLQVVAEYLGSQGHDIRILSTAHPDCPIPFRWSDQVEVLPKLQFKQPFPEPYAVPGHSLAFNFQPISQHLNWADRFYVHDGELLFPPLYTRIPTVVSFRDNSYAESIIGSFLFQGDALITVSGYSRDILLATAGQFIEGLPERTHTLPNGVDAQRFRATPPSRELLDLLQIDPARHTLLLHPHRPDADKGIDRTLEVAARLVRQYGIANLRVMIPRWLDADRSSAISACYEGVRQRAIQLGIGEHIHLHPWVPQRLMAEYYSLGSLSLALGNCAEAFGNSVYESLSCETPAIVARVGVHRSLLPDHLLEKVEYEEVEEAAALAARLIREKARTRRQTITYLRQHLSVEAQRQGYAELILNAQKRPPLKHRHPTLTDCTPFELPPWCHRCQGIRFYHDFLGWHHDIPQLARLLDRFRQPSRKDATRVGIDPGLVDQWYARGYLTPVRESP